jgi:uncharacterized protein (TIGR02145 family)/prepilin-type N-terminal cleavage/methylation domain-containing protein
VNKIVKKNSGFTIVELLVVIVVIGVLAAITVVSYTGISNKAIVSSMQSDLSASSRQFRLFTVDHSSYPVGDQTTAFDGNNCPKSPSTGIADTKYCLKLSDGNTIETYTGTTNGFTLAIKHGDNIIWEITNDSQPVSINPVPISVTSISGTLAEELAVTVGTITPTDAIPKVTYQWQRSDNNTFTTNLIDIPSATNQTYTLVTADVGKYIRAKVTGTIRFPGTVYSVGAGAVISPWVTLGTQTWSRYNLNVGAMLPNGTTMPVSGNGIEKWCYGDQESNCTTYGGLYSWNEMMQYVSTENAQGICPVGSHIPSDAQWSTLTTYLGTGAGTQLRPGGSSGMNIPFGGYRYYLDGTFNVQTQNFFLWSSSLSVSKAFIRGMLVSGTSLFRSTYDIGYGLSVRCLKN